MPSAPPTLPLPHSSAPLNQQADLSSLRSTLADKISYIEADLTAYAFPVPTKASSFRVRSRSLSGFVDGQDAASATPIKPIVLGGDTFSASEVCILCSLSLLCCRCRLIHMPTVLLPLPFWIANAKHKHI